MIEIREITDKNIWEEFVLSCPVNSFFQAWSWGEVLGRVWRLGIYDQDELVGVAQVVKITAKRGSFLHLRHGPIFKSWRVDYFRELVKELKLLGRKERVWFIRMSPLIEDSFENKNLFQKSGFKSVSIPRLDASLAWILEITKSEEELLAQMRKTTRYLIHKAEKIGIEIYEGKEESDFNSFLEIYRKTAQRQHFVPHSGIKEEFEILGKVDQVKLFLAKYHGKVMAGALIVFYGQQAVYHHSGAVLNSDLPFMYGLLWEAILAAKKKGKTFFNFWGISSRDKPSDPWWGLTLFKTGFGGEAKKFLSAQDFPLSPFYGLTRLIETFWKMKRGY